MHREPVHAASPDTIVAIATPPGVGALGIVRLSGPKAVAIAARHVLGKALARAQSHTLHFGRFRDATGNVLDEVVVSVFRAPKSYTREEVVEISAHGNPSILQAVVAALTESGARPAEPGEFTRRAFLNGALDLAQAEAVADLIAARSRTGQRLALGQLRGGVSNALSALRHQLLDFTALLELELDFAEEDVEFARRDALAQTLSATQTEVERLVASFAGGQALLQGIPTVLAGPPNAGKSTLLNRLLGDARAIVSATPGTTRDVLEDTFLLDGYLFRLTDTAGLRNATEEIEAEGIRRTHARLAKAPIVVYLFDASKTSEADAAAELQHLDLLPDAERILVGNKADLLSAPPAGDVLYLSAETGTGVESLLTRLRNFAAGLEAEDAQLTNPRHHYALRQAARALESARLGLLEGLGTELVALELRTALRQLGEVTGEVTPDDVLGSIFSRFCIGK